MVEAVMINVNVSNKLIKVSLILSQLVILVSHFQCRHATD